MGVKRTPTAPDCVTPLHHAHGDKHSSPTDTPYQRNRREKGRSTSPFEHSGPVCITPLRDEMFQLSHAHRPEVSSAPVHMRGFSPMSRSTCEDDENLDATSTGNVDE